MQTTWKRSLQIFSVFALLFMVAVSTSGCGEFVGGVIKGLVSESDDEQQDEQNQDLQQDSEKQDQENEDTDQAIKQKIDNLNTTRTVPFTNINWVNGPPSLQEKSGIYYYTKSKHPAEVENSFRYDTHNGWLLQLDPTRHREYNGYKMKVTQIAKTDQPSLYKITVHLEPGGESPTKPAYCFFEVGIIDMPTTASFVVVTDTGKPLIY